MLKLNLKNLAVAAATIMMLGTLSVSAHALTGTTAPTSPALKNTATTIPGIAGPVTTKAPIILGGSTSPSVNVTNGQVRLTPNQQALYNTVTNTATSLQRLNGKAVLSSAEQQLKQQLQNTLNSQMQQLTGALGGSLNNLGSQALSQLSGRLNGLGLGSLLGGGSRAAALGSKAKEIRKTLASTGRTARQITHKAPDAIPVGTVLASASSRATGLSNTANGTINKLRQPIVIKPPQIVIK